MIGREDDRPLEALEVLTAVHVDPCEDPGEREDESGHEKAPDDSLVDARQRLDIRDRRTFAHLVHGRIGQAEVDDRAQLDEEAAVRRAAAGGQFRRHARFVADGIHDKVEQLAGRRQEGLTGDPRGHRCSRRFPLGDFLDQADQVWTALQVIEPYVELRRRRAGNNVAGVGWGGDCRELEVGLWKCVVAGIEVQRVERRQDPRQLRDRIVRPVGVGDMALGSRHFDPHVDRTASADFYRVT